GNGGSDRSDPRDRRTASGIPHDFSAPRRGGLRTSGDRALIEVFGGEFQITTSQSTAENPRVAPGIRWRSRTRGGYVTNCDQRGECHAGGPGAGQGAGAGAQSIAGRPILQRERSARLIETEP